MVRVHRATSSPPVSTLLLRTHRTHAHSSLRTSTDGRPPLRPPHPGPHARLHPGRGPLTGARHRRQQRHLQRRARAAAQAAAVRQRRPPRHPLEHVPGPRHHRGLVLDRPVLRHQEQRDDVRPARHRHWRQREPDRPGRSGACRHDSRVVEPVADAGRASEPGPVVPAGRRRAGSRGDRGAGAWHLDAAIRRRPSASSAGRITLNGQPYTVIGVLPASFSLPREVLPTLGGAEDAEVLLPLPLGPEDVDGAAWRGLQPHRDVEGRCDARSRRRPRWTG